MKRSLIFNPEAEEDIFRLYEYIAANSSADRALRYIDRIDRFCSNLCTFPQRGHRLSNARSDIRIVGFERRACIAFRVDPEEIVILRILYGGRDVERLLSNHE